MTIATWRGGPGLFSAPSNWSPTGVPGSADLGVVNTGLVVLLGQPVGATVELAGTSSEAEPNLVLVQAFARSVTMPQDVPGPPYETTSSPPHYGAIDVLGQSRIGMIEVGAWANPVRAPDPYGHGPLAAVDHLDIALAPHSTLTASFDVKWDSTLAMKGAASSVFHAVNGTIEGGSVTLDAALVGPGTITLAHGYTDYTGMAAAGTLELGRQVGQGETIDIRMGNLQIDHPLEFHGTIEVERSENPVSSPPSYGPQTILLKGLTATGYHFDGAGHELWLYQGDHIVDRVAFTPEISAASFGPGYSGAIGIAQTSDGVFLRGQYAGYPTDATELPLHPAAT